MTDLDQAVLAARFRFRQAWREWMRVKNASDVETRVKATDELTAAERDLLEICKRSDP